MKKKLFSAMGLMSGTSMDGVDVSIIKSDGFDEVELILDKYYEYDTDLYKQLSTLRDKIKNSEDLTKYSKELSDLERALTIFHAEKISKIALKNGIEIDLIGFHGQTIFHNPQIKITKQLGDGNLLSQLLKKPVIYDFRQADIDNNGQGAPLTPIYHRLLVNNFLNKEKDNSAQPICIVNIGGISNATIINDISNNIEKDLIAYDIGPGNCLIDEWIRSNSNFKFDENVRWSDDTHMFLGLFEQHTLNEQEYNIFMLNDKDIYLYNMLNTASVSSAFKKGNTEQKKKEEEQMFRKSVKNKFLAIREWDIHKMKFLEADTDEKFKVKDKIIFVENLVSKINHAVKIQIDPHAVIAREMFRRHAVEKNSPDMIEVYGRTK